MKTFYSIINKKGTIELLERHGDYIVSSAKDYKYFISKNLPEESKGYSSYDLNTGLLVKTCNTKKELIEKMNDQELIKKIYSVLAGESYKNNYIPLYKKLLEENQVEIKEAQAC